VKLQDREVLRQTGDGCVRSASIRLVQDVSQNPAKSMSDGTHRRIFIGDIHGHYNGLMHLIEQISPGSDDQVYFVGDLIDRGPQSAQVIKFVSESGYSSVLGNHEKLLLDAFPEGCIDSNGLYAWLYSGGQETLSSYPSLEALLDHVAWVRTLPTYLDLGDVWLVHAGIHPHIPIAEQTSQEFCWIRSEFHSMTQPYFPDKLIITGHTITFTFPKVEPGELAQGQGWLDIDTGAYHSKSGWLTGLDLDHQRVYQVNVHSYESRVLPMAEAVAPIDPEEVVAHRRSLRLSP